MHKLCYAAPASGINIVFRLLLVVIVYSSLIGCADPEFISSKQPPTVSPPLMPSLQNSKAINMNAVIPLEEAAACDDTSDVSKGKVSTASRITTKFEQKHKRKNKRTVKCKNFVGGYKCINEVHQ